MSQRLSPTAAPLPPALVAPLRSISAAVGGLVAAAFIGVMALGLGLDEALAPSVRLVVAVLGGLLTLALVVASIQLGRRRGGLYFEPQGRGVGIGLTAANDLYWIPPEAFEGLAVRYHDRRVGNEIQRIWSAELICRDRPSVVLVEADEREVVANVVAQLSDDSHGTPGLTTVAQRAHDTVARDAASVDDQDLLSAVNDDESTAGAGKGGTAAQDALAPQKPAPSDRPSQGEHLRDGARLHTGVRRGFALAGMFWLFGASLLGVGAALLGQLDSSPMMAIFVAPVLILFGAVTFGIALAKRFAGEELLVVGDQLVHRWRFGQYTWSERAVDARAVAWRVRVQALKGAYLEALASDGSLAIGSGATTLSQLNIEALNRLPARLSAAAK